MQVDGAESGVDDSNNRRDRVQLGCREDRRMGRDGRVKWEKGNLGGARWLLALRPALGPGGAGRGGVRGATGKGPAIGPWARDLWSRGYFADPQRPTR